MARSIDNAGVGSVYASFNIDKTGEEYDLSTANEGQAVSLSGNNEVDLGASGGVFIGKLVSVQTDIAVVQVKGVVRVPYNTTSAPSLGGMVSVDGAGKVKSAAAGKGIVIALNAAAETADVLI